MLLIALNAVVLYCAGQSLPVPAEVTDSFARMFPAAKNVEWRNKVDNYLAFFKMGDEKCEAKFGKTGGWISTEAPIQWDSLPAVIRGELSSDGYADWTKTGFYILRLPGGVNQYHIALTRSDVGRKILFFDQEGQLLRH